MRWVCWRGAAPAHCLIVQRRVGCSGVSRGCHPNDDPSAEAIPVGNVIDVWQMCLRVTFSPPRNPVLVCAGFELCCLMCLCGAVQDHSPEKHQKLKQFFEAYGPAEAAAMCYLLATSDKHSMVSSMPQTCPCYYSFPDCCMTWRVACALYSLKLTWYALIAARVFAVADLVCGH
jgi:hypothetical protein